MWIYNAGADVNVNTELSPQAFQSSSLIAQGWMLSNYGDYDSEIHDISGPAIVDGQAVYTITEKANALAIVQENRATYIRNIAEEVLNTVVSPFQEKERETWHRQVAEADAYNSNPAAPTPMLSALIVERGNTVAAQVTRILGNKAAFETAVGTILGKQQNRLDQIYAATTVAVVRGVTWES